MDFTREKYDTTSIYPNFNDLDDNTINCKDYEK